MGTLTWISRVPTWAPVRGGPGRGHLYGERWLGHHEPVRLPIFELGASPYDLLTDQALWRDQVLRVLDHVPVRPRRILDLGCGPGVSAFALGEHLGAETEIVGIDIAKRMIALAERHHLRDHPHLDRVRFQHADATALPFDDRGFDLAVGHSFLYLCPDRPAVLREVRRVLRPGGTLVLLEPAAEGSLPRAALRAIPEAPVLWRHPLDAPRFLASMVLWRTVSVAAGRLDPHLVDRLFGDAGFVEVYTRPTLGGLGLHCVGRVPEG